MKASSGFLSRKRRREAAYQRGYEAGLEAATASCDPIAYLRHGEQTFVQNVPFGAMWISDKDDPRSFPVYDRPHLPAPPVAVKALEWAESIESTGRYASAKTPIGGYDVFDFSMSINGKTKTVTGWSGHWINAEQRTTTFDEAKAAAQADYEARIRSALSAQVQDVAERAFQAIADERLRQIGKGYDAAHDDRHVAGEIISATWGASARLWDAQECVVSGDIAGYKKYLIQAAAQIVAEYGRVERVAAPAKQEGDR